MTLWLNWSKKHRTLPLAKESAVLVRLAAVIAFTLFGIPGFAADESVSGTLEHRLNMTIDRALTQQRIVGALSPGRRLP